MEWSKGIGVMGKMNNGGGERDKMNDLLVFEGGFVFVFLHFMFKQLLLLLLPFSFFYRGLKFQCLFGIIGKNDKNITYFKNQVIRILF